MKYWLAIIIMFFCASTYAQNENLVLNPSFEDTLWCSPSGNQTVNKLNNCYNASNSTPDAYHYCNDIISPNLIDIIKRHTGLGRAVVFTFDTSFPEAREYIGMKLRDTLQLGTTYCFSAFIIVSKVEKFGTDNFGVYFGAGTQYYNTVTIAPVTPQLQLPIGVVLNDTANWYKLEGTFIATGNETDLVLGGFKTDAASLIPIINAAGANDGAIVVIDDVSLHELKVSAGNDTVICVGDSITIGELNLDTAFNSYYLYSGGAIIDSLQSQITIAPSVTTTYVLEKRMCQSVYDTVTITVKPRFTADVISSTLYLCINDSLTLNTLNSIGSTMWSWQPNIAITNLNLQQPTVYPSQTLQYTVTTNFANSSNYCNSTFTDTVQIIVLSDDTCSEEINLIVPNIFSPNYDGLNDVFTIINFSGDIKEYSCTIFNRWGNLIFETKKRAQFWDGRSTSGIACEPGTYYYVIKAENSIGTKEYKGFVQLVR